MLILPRQAQDKHRENSKKETVFLQVRRRAVFTEFLTDCGVPAPMLFLRAENDFAALSGLLFPFFWNAHLVNEQQEFLSFASAHKTKMPEVRYTRVLSNRMEFASVDGVRALSPVVCSLNFSLAGWMLYMIYAFPVPQTWSPSMYFGVCWCALVAVLLVSLSFTLIRSLSENRHAASRREIEIIWGWGTHKWLREVRKRISFAPL